MDVSFLLQGIGWLACLVAIGFIAILAVLARIISGQRGEPMEPHNSAVRSLSEPYEAGDFGGVPTTGSVQDYERDWIPEQIIGSSGFNGQQNEDVTGEEE
jgi:hypothetical protein